MSKRYIAVCKCGKAINTYPPYGPWSCDECLARKAWELIQNIDPQKYTGWLMQDAMKAEAKEVLAGQGLLVDNIKDYPAPQALRYNTGKPPLHLLAGEWQNEVARVMGYGAAKYEPNNWRKGGPWCEHLASVQRHILAFQNGEDLDPESGLSHLAHAICGMFFVLEWVLRKQGEDDRYSQKSAE